MSKEAKPGSGQTILIVEDSVDFSNLLKFLIEDEGFQGVQFPIDHESIVEWVKKHKPITILMDLALRRKGGMEYIEELKADPVTKSIPIIILTGRDLGSKEVFDLQMRGIRYLRKGRIEIEDIKNEIREAALSAKKARAHAKDSHV